MGEPSGAALEEDAYSVLGVRADASATELRKAYQQLALLHHPDHASAHGDSEGDAFRRVQRAWEQVREPSIRCRYDAERRAAALYDASVAARTLDVDLGEMQYEEDARGGGIWQYTCNCGDGFTLTEQQLESGVEMVACRSCSLVLRPLYQRAPT